MAQNITPFIWFDNQAEEAMNFYVSIFKDSKVLDVSRRGEDGPGEPGSVWVASFQIEGQEFTAINGGPYYKLTPAISFMVSCETQDEVDKLWDALVEGGAAMQCGWVTDRFGVTWQIIPRILSKLIQDPERSGRVVEAMMQMEKIDIAGLQRAYDGE